MNKEQIILKTVRSSSFIDIEGKRMAFNNELPQFKDVSTGILSNFFKLLRNFLFIEDTEDNSVGLLKYQEDRAMKLKRTPAEAVNSVPRYQNHHTLDSNQSPGKAHLSNFIEKIR